jgi:hypothetical protein
MDKIFYVIAIFGIITTMAIFVGAYKLLEALIDKF